MHGRYKWYNSSAPSGQVLYNDILAIDPPKNGGFCKTQHIVFFIPEPFLIVNGKTPYSVSFHHVAIIKLLGQSRPVYIDRVCCKT